jgi:hypothetical protein
MDGDDMVDSPFFEIVIASGILTAFTEQLSTEGNLVGNWDLIALVY